MDINAFAIAEQTVRAVKYSLLIVSEAATKLGDLAPDPCPDIAWRDIRGLGNRLRHEYDGIDVVRIWFLSAGATLLSKNLDFPNMADY